MRMKEEETHLNLHEHDDDDDDETKNEISLKNSDLISHILSYTVQFLR